MNAINLNFLTNAVKAAFLLGILPLAFFVSRSSLIAHPQMSCAIVIDLTFTFPLAYLFFIRKTSVSKLTAIPKLFSRI